MIMQLFGVHQRQTLCVFASQVLSLTYNFVRMALLYSQSVFLYALCLLEYILPMLQYLLPERVEVETSMWEYVRFWVHNIISSFFIY